MSKKLITSAIALAIAVAAGCQNKPQSIRRVDQSVLPAAAKGMLSQEAQITRVEEVRYNKGTTVYRIHYTAEGKSKTLDYNAKDETTPTGVFQQ
jgi:predicted nuclease with RNAse H fold